jgi:hypothetical protein
VPGWDNRIYSVEVSGWNVENRFFVERTSLYMGQPGTKTVVLHSDLRSGLLVFIRLLSTTFAGKRYPKVYRVQAAELPDHAGFSRVHLAASEPGSELEYDATSASLKHLSLQEHKSRVKA